MIFGYVFMIIDTIPERFSVEVFNIVINRDFTGSLFYVF